MRWLCLDRKSCIGLGAGLVALLLSSAVGHAQTAPVLDHFKCYFTFGQSLNRDVILQDQFDAAAGIKETVLALTAVRFCNPVSKDHAGQVTPIVDPNAHLKLYLIRPTDPPVTRSVVVSNQFGANQRLRVYGAEVLAVPTQKIVPGNHAFPTDLDHFKCYRAEGRRVNATVDLEDQFHRERNVRVLRPFGLCNPTTKEHPGQSTLTPILHPDAHLVCYKITGRSFTGSVTALNQFGTEVIPVRTADLLCVPSAKRHD
jgi:hypothetical protein